MCHELGQHQCPFTAKTIGKCATQTMSVLHPLKRALVCQPLQDHNLLHHLWHHLTHQTSMMNLWPISGCMDWTLNQHITSVMWTLRQYPNMPPDCTWRSCMMLQTKGNWNTTNQKHCNIQIANVSYQLKLLAETCGHYSRSHLNLLRTLPDWCRVGTNMSAM